MPYANEHAARLRDPGDFANIVQLWKNDAGIRALGGRLKSDPEGSTVEQAIRFDAGKWTVDEAKKWLKDRDYKVILFEPATEAKAGRPAIERRVLAAPPLELRKAEDGGEHLVGFAAVYNQLSVDLGFFREKISPGAFHRAFEDGADVAALWNHNPDKILGRTVSGTLKLRDEPDKGLAFDLLMPRSPLGQEVAESVRRRDTAGASFGFMTNKDLWEDTPQGIVRTLIDVDLFDVSPTPFPAYPQTEAALRSLDAWQRSRQAAEAAKAASQGKVEDLNRNARARVRLAMP
jgi:HK97 family phage prohead protease